MSVATAGFAHPAREHRLTLRTPRTIAPFVQTSPEATRKTPAPSALGPLPSGWGTTRPVVEAYPRPVVTARGSRRRRLARRDRRGRGLRGPLYPSSLPIARSRSQIFDALVLEALEPIEKRWRAELTELDVAVDEVPELTTTAPDKLTWDDDVVVDSNVPLARLVPAGVDRRGLPTRARIVLYRRPLETRARDGTDMADLLHDVLVEQIAHYLGLDPEVIEGG